MKLIVPDKLTRKQQSQKFRNLLASINSEVSSKTNNEHHQNSSSKETIVELIKGWLTPSEISKLSPKQQIAYFGRLALAGLNSTLAHDKSN